MEHVKQIAIKAVGEVLGISYAQMNEVSLNGRLVRKFEYAEARRLVIALLKEKAHFTYTSAGNIFNLHHTTSMHAINQHNDLLEFDKKYAYKWEVVKSLYDQKINRYNAKAALETPEIRSQIQDTLNRLLKESKRCIYQLNESIKPHSAVDLGFSVVNLNE